MHELAAAEQLLRIAIQHAEQADAIRITAVHIVIGQLSTMIDDSVQFYWDIMTANTLAEGSQLHFRRVPARLQCANCGRIYDLNGAQDFLCPDCGAAGAIISGEEFLLEAIDIKTADEMETERDSYPGG